MQQPGADLRVAELIRGTSMEASQVDDPLGVRLDRSPGQLPEGKMIDEAVSEREPLWLPRNIDRQGDRSYSGVDRGSGGCERGGCDDDF